MIFPSPFPLLRAPAEGAEASGPGPGTDPGFAHHILFPGNSETGLEKLAEQDAELHHAMDSWSKAAILDGAPVGVEELTPQREAGRERERERTERSCPDIQAPRFPTSLCSSARALCSRVQEQL